jgi:hypothetical protein
MSSLFMELEASLPYLQYLPTWPYAESIESSPQPHVLFLQDPL